MDRKEPEERKQEIIQLDEIINSFGKESDSILEILPHVGEALQTYKKEDIDVESRLVSYAMLRILGYMLARLGLLFIGSNVFFTYLREMIETNNLHLTDQQIKELEQGMAKLSEEIKRGEKARTWLERFERHLPQTEREES